jgi:hypothetical protein
MDHLSTCPSKNGWWITLPKGSGGFKKKNLLGIERPNEREKLIQLASCHTKFLENGSPKDDVENVCEVHM